MHGEGYGYKFLEEIKTYSPWEANPTRISLIVEFQCVIPSQTIRIKLHTSVGT